MAETKTISFDDGLRARAIFTMAADHYREGDRYTRALGKLLGYPAGDQGYLGHLSDAMGDGTTFDEALRKEGFVVNPETEE